MLERLIGSCCVIPKTALALEGFLLASTSKVTTFDDQDFEVSGPLPRLAPADDSIEFKDLLASATCLDLPSQAP